MGEGKQILLAEDDDAIRQLIADVLMEAGYVVTEARNAAEALDRVARSSPHLVLLDNLMPGGDGTEFAASYAKLRPPRAPIARHLGDGATEPSGR